MIHNVLTTDGFYFCTDYDLTHTLQRLANTSPDFQEMSLLERVSSQRMRRRMMMMIQRPCELQTREPKKAPSGPDTSATSTR